MFSFLPIILLLSYAIIFWKRKEIRKIYKKLVDICDNYVILISVTVPIIDLKGVTHDKT